MAAVVQPTWGVLSPSEIVSYATERMTGYRSRDAWYDKLSSYYMGPELNQISSGMPHNLPIIAMDSKGRPLLRPMEVGSSLHSKRNYNGKRLAPIIDDFVGLKGRMPSSRVIPPDGPQGEAFAQHLTYYLISTHSMSDMELQQPLAGTMMSMLGDAVYVLAPAQDPDSSNYRVVWEVLSPRVCYPSFFRSGWRRHRVYDLIIQQAYSWYEINLTYHDYGIQVPPNAPLEDCTVTTYISQYQRTSVVGIRSPKRAEHQEWDLRFCPVVWAWNKAPGEMGQADIAHALDQQDFYDFLMSVMADGIVGMTYPIVVVKDADQVNAEQLVRGPDAPPVYVQGTGGVEAIGTQGNIQPVLSMVQQTLDDINAGTGSSEVRQTGHLKSSVSTGRAIHAAQGPQSTRIDLWQQQMGNYIRTLNEMTLHMQETAPFLKEFKGDVFGQYKGRGFQIEFRAGDIKGWYRNHVHWESLVGLNDQQKISIAYEGLAAKLWNRDYARELAGVDDPIAMDDRIEQDILRDAKIQADVQRLMEGGGQGGPPGGGQPALPQGQPPPGQGQGGRPPGMIARPRGFQGQFPRLPNMGGGRQQAQPPPQAPAAPPTPKMGVTIDDLRRVLALIATSLRGSVYAVGELAQQGGSQAPEIAITEQRDYIKVMTTVRQVAPNAKVRVAKESEMGPEKALLAEGVGIGIA